MTSRVKNADRMHNLAVMSTRPRINYSALILRHVKSQNLKLGCYSIGLLGRVNELIGPCTYFNTVPNFINSRLINIHLGLKARPLNM